MPSCDRVRRVFLHTTAGFMAVAFVLAAFGWIERERNKEAEYEVYSAYLSEGLLNDAHDWSTAGPVQVVIADKTISGGNLRFPFTYLFDRRVNFVSLQSDTCPVTRLIGS